MTIRKAVVLAAGHGTRLLPVTKTVPKEMLPLVDRPIIQYIVEEAVAAGVTEVVLVTAAGKRAIEDYFDRSPELEAHLEARGDRERLAELRRISDLVEVVSVRQKRALGVGDAVLTARDVVGTEPFLLFFPDDVIDAPVPAAKQLIDAHDRAGGCVLAVERVPWDEVESYGVIEGEEVGGALWRVHRLVEKPPREQAPSNLAIVGRYVLTPEVFAALAQTRPGAGGEIQLTDAIATLLPEQPVHALQFDGVRYDCGRPFGLLRAALELALKRPELGPQLRRHLASLQSMGRSEESERAVANR